MQRLSQYERVCPGFAHARRPLRNLSIKLRNVNELCQAKRCGRLVAGSESGTGVPPVKPRARCACHLRLSPSRTVKTLEAKPAEYYFSFAHAQYAKKVANLSRL